MINGALSDQELSRKSGVLITPKSGVRICPPPPPKKHQAGPKRPFFSDLDWEDLQLTGLRDLSPIAQDAP